MTVSPEPGEQRPARGASTRLNTLLLWIGPLVFLGLFFFYPLYSILNLSFARGEAGLAAPFLQVFSSSSLRGVVGFTFGQATLSTLLTLMVGLPGAYLLARYSFRGKPLIRALTGIPFVMPTLVVAAAFNALLGPRGWLNLGLMQLLALESPPLQFTNSLTAILVAHVFYNTTIVLRMVGDFWSHLDPRITQAARVLGAGRWETLRKITLPLLLPAIATASLLVFIFDFTSFGVVLVLGGPRFATMEVEIYYQTVSLFNLPLAAALSIIQLMFTLILTVLYTRLSARISQPISLRAARLAQQPLSGLRRRLMAGAILVPLLALLILPLASLAFRSFVQIGPAGVDRTAEPGLTARYYQELSQNPQGALFYVTPLEAIRNSLLYASAAAGLALLIGLPASWSLARDSDSRLNRWLDPLLMLPLGTSSVTLGLGFIVALDSPPLNLRTSPLLVPLAHTLVAFPFVVRSLTPSLRSIQPQLREAARTLGASPSRVVRHIDLPLVGRALLVAAIFAFTVSLGEFGATALVSRPEFPTIPVVIYRFLSRPGALNFGQAMALGTILMAITGFSILFIERFRIADIGEF